jgi:hypothetical protein
MLITATATPRQPAFERVLERGAARAKREVPNEPPCGSPRARDETRRFVGAALERGADTRGRGATAPASLAPAVSAHETLALSHAVRACAVERAPPARHTELAARESNGGVGVGFGVGAHAAASPTIRIRATPTLHIPAREQREQHGLSVGARALDAAAAAGTRAPRAAELGLRGTNPTRTIATAAARATAAAGTRLPRAAVELGLRVTNPTRTIATAARATAVGTRAERAALRVPVVRFVGARGAGAAPPHAPPPPPLLHARRPEADARAVTAGPAASALAVGRSAEPADRAARPTHAAAQTLALPLAPFSSAVPPADAALAPPRAEPTATRRSPLAIDRPDPQTPNELARAGGLTDRPTAARTRDRAAGVALDRAPSAVVAAVPRGTPRRSHAERTRADPPAVALPAPRETRFCATGAARERAPAVTRAPADRAFAMHSPRAQRARRVGRGALGSRTHRARSPTRAPEPAPTATHAATNAAAARPARTDTRGASMRLDSVNPLASARFGAAAYPARNGLPSPPRASSL